MRTRYGRLTLGKSGQAAREMTERDKWIYETFTFIGKHIVRFYSKHGVSVSIDVTLIVEHAPKIENICCTPIFICEEVNITSVLNKPEVESN